MNPFSKHLQIFESGVLETRLTHWIPVWHMCDPLGALGTRLAHWGPIMKCSLCGEVSSFDSLLAVSLSKEIPKFAPRSRGKPAENAGTGT